jgi:hypothetical protein
MMKPKETRRFLPPGPLSSLVGLVLESGVAFLYMLMSGGLFALLFRLLFLAAVFGQSLSGLLRNDGAVFGR